MKVRINYQINLRDVPNTIADLIDKICNSINWNTSFGSNTQSLSSLARRLRDGENISQIIDDISQYREQLSEIDSSLEDYCYILAQAQKTESEIFLAKKEIKESSVINEEVQQQLQKELEKEKENYDKTCRDIPSGG